MATPPEAYTSVASTDFYKDPGTVICQSQRGPVVLTKNRRRYAAVVSIDYLDRAAAALAAMHANRRVFSSGRMIDDDAERIEASLPSEAETTAGRSNWRER